MLCRKPNIQVSEKLSPLSDAANINRFPDGDLHNTELAGGGAFITTLECIGKCTLNVSKTNAT